MVLDWSTDMVVVGWSMVSDVEQDQMQAKIHLYTHISAYIQAFNNK